VPTLPLNIPRREFGVYSWLALFQAQVCGFSRVLSASVDRTMYIQELQCEATDDLNKFMSLDELGETFSGKRVKFAVERGEV